MRNAILCLITFIVTVFTVDFYIQLSKNNVSTDYFIGYTMILIGGSILVLLITNKNFGRDTNKLYADKSAKCTRTGNQSQQ